MICLIITEKFSVASAIANFLKLDKNRGGYFQGNDYQVSWASGHLLELFDPEDYDKKLKRWSFNTLPIIPDKFNLKAKDNKQLDILLKLLKQDKVTQIVNACDAGREGELIFRYIYEFSKCNIPVKRLWLNSLTRESIEHSFNNLLEQNSLDSLFYSAKCRAESDWLVGINGSRSFTLKHKTLLPLGRVQTPILAIINKRDTEIESFVPQAYFELFARFSSKEGVYSGKWTQGKEDRIFDLKKAEALQKKIHHKEGVVKSFKDVTEKVVPPLLFDLGSLQKEANQRFSLTASKTLNIAQSLYDKKLITYPRTDSKFLPQTYKKEIQAIFHALKNTEYHPFIEPIKTASLAKPRIFNDQRVTDHHAIIPTTTEPAFSSLNKDEVKIYDLIVKRFIAAFLEPDIYRKLSIETMVESELFITTERVLIKPGWSLVYNRNPLAPIIDFVLEKGDRVKTLDSYLKEGVTQPPPYFTDGTIISMLETAGKLIEDEELKGVLKDKGLGTPATRAQIIDRLITHRYLEREKNLLKITPKGKAFIEVVEKEVPDLASPELTAGWEFRLKLIEKQKENRNVFMEDIINYVREMVNTIKTSDVNVSLKQASRVVLAHLCPLCGKSVQENRLAYACIGYKDGCKGTIWKRSFGRNISLKEAEKLLAEGKIGPLWFTSKNRKKYSALLVFSNHGVSLEFTQLKTNKEVDEKNKQEKQTEKPDHSGSIIKELFIEDNHHNISSGIKKPEIIPEKNLMKKSKSSIKIKTKKITTKKKQNQTKPTTIK